MNKIFEIIPLDGKKIKFTSIEDIIDKLIKINPKEKIVKRWIHRIIDILSRRNIETYLCILHLFNKRIDIQITGITEIKNFYKLLNIKPIELNPIQPLGIQYLSDYFTKEHHINLTPKHLSKYYHMALKEIEKLEEIKVEDKGSLIPFDIFLKSFQIYLTKIDKLFVKMEIIDKPNKIIVKETKNVGSFSVSYPIFYIYRFDDKLNLYNYVSTAIHEYIHFLQFLPKNKLNYFVDSIVIEGFAHYIEEILLPYIPNMLFSYKIDTLLRLYRYKLIYEFHTEKITTEQMKKEYLNLMGKEEGIIEFYYSLINPRKMIYYVGKKMFQEKKFDWKKAIKEGAVYQAKILKLN